MEIKGYDCDEILIRAAEMLLESPEYAPRGQRTKELIQPTLIIENPEKCVITNPARKLSEDYLKAEMDWYLSCERSIEGIKDHSKLWEKIADENGEVNSNYGRFVFGFDQTPNYIGNQFSWVIESLKRDKDSRQALINFNQTQHKQDGVKDFVCTITTQYLIRDNKLIGVTNMRSNDLIYGFSYDFPFFSFIQQMVCDELKSDYPDLVLGRNIHTPTSLHVYERHFKMLEEIIKHTSQSKSLSEVF